MVLGDVDELQQELTARNREIAKTRDELGKSKSACEEWQERNAGLLEANAKLDQETTQRRAIAAELEEKVQILEGRIEEMAVNANMVKEQHLQQLQSLREEMSSFDDVKAAAREASAQLQGRVDELEADKARISEELQREQSSHATTKATLLQSEESARDLASSAAALRTRMKALEEDLTEQAASSSALEVERLEAQRRRSAQELGSLQNKFEEEMQARDAVGSELETLRMQADESAKMVASLEAAHGLAESQLSASGADTEENLQELKARHDAFFEKATKEAADLRGRLDGQRFLQEASAEDLQEAGQHEQRLEQEIQARDRALAEQRTELSTCEASFVRHRERSSQDSVAQEARLLAHFESEQTIHRSRTQGELASAQRLATDTERREQHLLAELSAFQAQSRNEVNDLRSEQRQKEMDLLQTKGAMEEGHNRANDLEVKLRSMQRSLDVQQARADAAEKLRRETEQQVRSDAAATEAKLQAELRRVRQTLEDHEVAASTRAEELEERIANEAASAKAGAAMSNVVTQQLRAAEESQRALYQRGAMSVEELQTRRASHALELRRLTGALEESRRTLRNNMINAVGVADVGRVSALEQQLSDERRKGVQTETEAGAQRRRVQQLEEQLKRREEDLERAREAQRAAMQLGADELPRLRSAKGAAEQRSDENRERAAMAVEELNTVRYEKTYENAKLRGSLNELRMMIRTAGVAR